MTKKQPFEQGFFASCETEKIWQLWNQYNTLLELAIGLELSKNQHLTRNDYEYIEKIKKKWHLISKSQYKFLKCKVSRWGKFNNILTLELHHKDKNHKNSLISNLELLCPNCHCAQ
jgi:hypothetical protein